MLRAAVSRLSDLYENYRFGYDRVSRRFKDLGIRNVVIGLWPTERYHEESPGKGAFPDGWSELSLTVSMMPKGISFLEEKRRVAYAAADGRMPNMQRYMAWKTAEKRRDRYIASLKKHGIAVE
ncbi:MAG: hypothetical protein HYS62_02100 [Candidatus Aenigmarchaeota archaeon]|nr:hypothetical protein [Candidatus Aenigmarchaeota archaeon]